MEGLDSGPWSGKVLDPPAEGLGRLAFESKESTASIPKLKRVGDEEWWVRSSEREAKERQTTRIELATAKRSKPQRKQAESHSTMENGFAVL